MALTPSAMIELGSACPDFELSDAATGKTVARDDFAAAPALLVIFMCNHCPYVIHVRDELAKLGREYQERGVAVVAINSNDAQRYPEDSPANMKRAVKDVGYTFSYLFDESQEVARAFNATCTPDFFLYDKNRRLVYRGQLDDSRPGNGEPVTGRDLRAAIDATLQGKAAPGNQRPSMGCNIKWK